MDLDLPFERLAAYLPAHISGFGELRDARKFPDGQSNPTYQLTATSGLYVLRRKPFGTLLKSAHAVEREFQVLTALASSDVPVPKVFHLCEDDTVIGAAFYVMGFVRGRTFWDPLLPDQPPNARAAMYDQMNLTLAAIHSVDLELAGLKDFGRAGNYYARQHSVWTRAYAASQTIPIPAMAQVGAWLGQNLPPDDGRIALVHGDYRLDNLMMAPDAPQVIAVMDWELSTLGHPLADLAFQCGIWRMPATGYLGGFGEVDRTTLGIPSEAAYIERYCTRAGLDGIANWPFYLAFGLFRLAAIAQGVEKRAQDGNASSRNAHQIGALVRPLAEKARDIIDQDR